MSETIRVKPAGARWQSVGPEGDFGWCSIENTEATSNEWGSDTLSFNLKAEPGKQRPDLFPYTPIEYLVDGDLVWAGWIRSRLGDDTFDVNALGWQYHLDDDQYDRVYVQNRLSDWVDARDHPGTLLGYQEYNAEGEVGSLGFGEIYMMWPADSLIYAFARCGVILDLGPDSTAKRVVVTWASSNKTANVTFFARGVNVPVFGSTGNVGAEDLFSIVNNAGNTGTSSGTFVTTRRYLVFFMYQTNVNNYYTAADIWFILRTVQVFRATAYESGNASILKADQVIKDALPFAPLLNQDTSLIQAGSYSIPEYKTGGFKTPRQAMQEPNTYENFQLTLGGQDLKTIVYRAKPTNPLFEVGEWSGGPELNDSALSGDEVFNKVRIEATGPDGIPVFVSRTQTAPMIRDGRTRSQIIQVGSGIATADANRLGDTWLAEHRTTPFSGNFSVTGTAIRRVRGGEGVRAHLLLRACGEKIRLAHQIDPDTGNQGRDGRIVAVTYHGSTDSLDITIDDRRDDFVTMQRRLDA